MTDRVLHVGLLVPAYGEEILGGAEYGARMIAEHLVATGCRVTVWTSTALRAADWAPHYPPGHVTINGVEVHRFVSGSRHPDFGPRSQPVLASPAAAPALLAEQWIEDQGPACPAALDAAATSTADVVLLYPYLYWPTVHGARRLRRRAVLHPAAHDEAPLRLPLFDEVFTAVGGLLFQTDAERRLVGARFPASLTVPQATLGLGVEAPPALPDGDAAARRRLGVGDRPYVLCLGRIDEHKGSTLLAQWWSAYKARNPGPWTLVFAGPGTARLPAHPDIVVTGPVSEDDKWAVLRNAEVLISPSPYESFSLVLLEAWAVGRPTMVNGACAPTTEHCMASGGGIPFSGFATFEVALARLAGDASLRRAMGAAGRAYVESRYSWSALGPRFAAFLGQVAARRDTAASNGTPDRS